MKKEGLLLGLFIVAMLLMGACKKTTEEGSNNAEVEQAEIEDYASKNNLDGQFTSTGLYYVIVEPGNDKHPTAGSTITVSYNGYFLNGTVFDSGDFFTSKINQLIIGWQEGIPLIGEGGKIKLIIPSHLGYNDSVRVFDVSLHYFSK